MHASSGIRRKMVRPTDGYPRGDAAAAVVQWGKRSPIEEVGAEFTFVDHRYKIPMRGTDHAHIGVNRGSAAETLKLSFLYDAKQLRLQLQRSSPISSKNNVPRLARSNRPIPRVTAPV